MSLVTLDVVLLQFFFRFVCFVALVLVPVPIPVILIKSKALVIGAVPNTTTPRTVRYQMVAPHVLVPVVVVVS